MAKAIGRILTLTFLLENLALDSISGVTTVTSPHHESHQAVGDVGGRCEDMRVGLSLNLRDVGMHRLDSDFTESPDVSCLSLEDNDIADVSPSSFNSLPNLLHLNLARNNLSLVNFSQIDRHPRLRALVLDDNARDPCISLEFANTFPQLAYLYLRNCSIADIASLSFAPALVHLNLSANNLGKSKLAFLNEAPIALTSLDLSNNRMENLNASGLPSVVRLRLDDNKFERLCGKSYCNEAAVLMLEGAPKLQWFSASRNALRIVDSDAFDDTVNIAHLDLSHNKIDSIQKGTFEKLEDLTHLSLEDNLLKAIPELCNLESLQQLRLAKNYLRVVHSDVFCQIENLTFVDLSDNRIESVEDGALDKLIHLGILKLSNNFIMTFPSSWLERLKNLRSLHVDGNRLKSLSDLALGGLHMYAKLNRVFAQNNLIDKLYTGSLHSEVRNRPNVTIQLFDVDASTSKAQKIVFNEDTCECNCYDDNDIPL